MSLFLTWLVKRWAIKKSIIDFPNERSSHSTPTPRGGGFAIVFVFYVCILFFYIKGQIEKDLFFALLPGFGLALVGIFDDLKSLSPSIRIIVQFLCSGIALYFLGGFHSFFNDDLVWLWSLIALVGFVWFINLFNFLDGSDGYASMEALSISLALWFFTGTNVFLLLVFSVCGFLYWNCPKAKIFMGDAGSTTLGFILVVFGIYLHNKGTFNFTYWILITALFWFDATVTLMRRIINKEHLSKAHKNHIFQRAILGGFSHLEVLISGLGINLILFFICFCIWKDIISYLSGFLIAFLILWFAMKYVDKKFAFVK